MADASSLRLRVDGDKGIIGVILAPPALPAGCYAVEGAQGSKGQAEALVLLVDSWTERRASHSAPRSLRKPKHAESLVVSSVVGSDNCLDVQPDLTEVVEDLWSKLGPMTWARVRASGEAIDVAAAWCGARLVAVVAPSRPEVGGG